MTLTSVPWGQDRLTAVYCERLFCSGSCPREHTETRLANCREFKLAVWDRAPTRDAAAWTPLTATAQQVRNQEGHRLQSGASSSRPANNLRGISGQRTGSGDIHPRAHVEWWGRCEFEPPREMMTLLLLGRLFSLLTNARVFFRS